MMCAGFLMKTHIVSPEMRLQPNIGSDRSWVWKVHADYADGEATSETLAIRFANAESKSLCYDPMWFVQLTLVA